MLALSFIVSLVFAASFNADTVTMVREDFVDLRSADSAAHSPATLAYFRHYNLDVPGAEHRFGYFNSHGYRLAAHCFRPPRDRGTVLLMHGYLEHSGYMSRIIRDLTARGYAVAAYDMPGHGLSSGYPAAIGEFQTYSYIFEEFICFLRDFNPGPVHVIAHSTGGSAVIDYLIARQNPRIDKVVLIAPLVRSSQWYLAKMALLLTSPFMDEVPRVFRRTSSEEEFLRFERYDDPLTRRTVSLRWVEALFAWNRIMPTRPPSEKSLLVIQGTKDTIVDRDFNTRFMQWKFPMAEFVFVEGGNHQLLNESSALYQWTLREIDAWLRR